MTVAVLAFPAPVVALPPIAPGQLRCQVCARGVPRAKRFCESCSAERAAQHGTLDAPKYKPKHCKEPSCRKLFQPTGPRSEYCPECR